MPPLWQSSLSKSVFYWVCPPPAFHVISSSPYEMSHCLLAAFKTLFVFWLINIDGLGVGFLNKSCLGFVERHTLLLNVFRQLWDISVLSFLTTSVLSHSSALGIPPRALDGNSQVSETIRFSVLFLSLGLPKQIYFVGFTAHQVFIYFF